MAYDKLDHHEGFQILSFKLRSPELTDAACEMLKNGNTEELECFIPQLISFWKEMIESNETKCAIPLEKLFCSLAEVSYSLSSGLVAAFKVITLSNEEPRALKERASTVLCSIQRCINEIDNKEIETSAHLHFFLKNTAAAAKKAAEEASIIGKKGHDFQKIMTQYSVIAEKVQSFVDKVKDEENLAEHAAMEAARLTTDLTLTLTLTLTGWRRLVSPQT